MSEERILRTLRAQAWERAKGELMSVMDTFWGDSANFLPLDKLMKDFIKEVEEHGLTD